MRGLVDGLDNPHPLGAMLPGVFVEDAFTQRLTAALDDVIAPVLSTLENLDAYLDPRLTPADFLAWLAEWMGLRLDETWPEPFTRELVDRAVELTREHGTRAGLTALLTLYTGVVPGIEDSGGVSWSASPDADPPGGGPPALTVRLSVPDPSGVDRRRVEAIVAGCTPAHVPFTVEISEISRKET